MRLFVLTARSVLTALGLGLMVVAFGFWLAIQMHLTGSKYPFVAGALALILAVGPSALLGFLIPNTPLAQAVMAQTWRSWGMAVIALSVLGLGFYTWSVLTGYWSSQPVAVETNLVRHQVVLGLLGFLVIPGLIWAPYSLQDAQELLWQAHVVRRYKIITAADLALHQARLLNAQCYALQGYSSLTLAEQQEFAATVAALQQGIGQTLGALGNQLDNHATIRAGFLHEYQEDDPEYREEQTVQEYLGYLSQALRDQHARLLTNGAPNANAGFRDDPFA